MSRFPPGAGRDGGGSPVAGVIAKFDLRLILAENGTALAGAVEYSTALFDAATIGRLAGHLGVLLAAIAADPAAPLSRLPVLTAGEREQLLAGWNDTAAPVPAAGGVHELITERAAVCPDAVAVASGDACLTYRELVERAGRLAGYLRQEGVAAESVVGLCLEPGPEMITLILATWLAGAAYLPLDPGYPAARLAFMLADSRASVVAGTVSAAGDLPAGRLRVITVDDPVVRAGIAAGPPAPPGVRVVPGQLAYVIYTSGSAGVPKGVQVPHGAVVNYVAFAAAAYPGAGAGSVLHSPMSSDLTVTALLVPLVLGGRVQVAGLDDARLAGGAGLVKVTPSHLLLLDELGGAGGCADLVVGGEQLTGELVAGWRGRHPAAAVTNEYGPTEVTVGCVSYRAGPGQVLAAGVVPVGRPVWNTRVYVLDGSLSPVPAGVPG